MAEPVVLCSYVLGDARFRSDKYRTVGIPCIGDRDYYDGWCAFWDTQRTIVNVEHDMQVSDKLIGELLDCPHVFCTYAYLLYPVTTGKRTHYAQALSRPHSEDWVAEGAQWCAFSGIGFCKIMPEARVRSLEERHWMFMDLAVSWGADVPVHVHWPAVEHHHR